MSSSDIRTEGRTVALPPRPAEDGRPVVGPASPHRSPAPRKGRRRRLYKPLVFFLCLAPLAYLAWNTLAGNLSANPIDDITDFTGRWTLRLLLISLAVRPLRQLTGFNELIQYRRMIGLFAFFYSIIHVSIFVVLDYFFDFPAMLAELPERPFVTAGFTAFVCLIPLALTSTRGWIVRLGGRRWRTLHRLVYVSACAGVLHYLWIEKVVGVNQVAYALALAALMTYRIVVYWKPGLVSRGR